MRNALFLIGGGLLTYWYMCNEKRYGCNCSGDVVKKIGDQVSSEIKEVSRDFKDAVLEKDGAATIKPKVASSGEFAPIREQEIASELTPVYSASYLPKKNIVTRDSISRLYKRYNTKKSATVSPSRVRVIVID